MLQEELVGVQDFHGIHGVLLWLSSCPSCVLILVTQLVLDEAEDALEHQAALLALVVQVARSNIPIVCKLTLCLALS